MGTFDRSGKYKTVLLVLAGMAGCSGDRDSLKNERASMEQEAKALAERDSKPMQPPAPVSPAARPAEPGAAVSPVASSTGSGVRIPSGFEVQVLPTQALSSRTAQTGADWMGKLAAEFKVDGVVLAPAGADVVGRFILVSDGTKLRKKHELELRLYKLKATSGQFVDVRTMSLIQVGALEGKQPVVILANQPLTFKMGSGLTLPR